MFGYKLVKNSEYVSKEAVSAAVDHLDVTTKQISKINDICSNLDLSEETKSELWKACFLGISGIIGAEINLFPGDGNFTFGPTKKDEA